MHHHDREMGKNYMWIFKDSIKADIDTFVRSSWVKERDIKNSFVYKGNYPITVWDFKDLYSADLKDASINSNVNIPDLDISWGSGEILSSNCNPQTYVKYGPTFDNKINVNLDSASIIYKNIESENYKGFVGLVNRMAFTNGKNENYILFNYPDKIEKTLFLLYKSSRGFFVIIVQSNNKKYVLDESLINIFNLK